MENQTESRLTFMWSDDWINQMIGNELNLLNKIEILKAGWINKIFCKYDHNTAQNYQ